MSFLFSCSVDDGDPADARLADLLGWHGLRATFYLPIHNREGAPVMPPAQMRELGRHFEIGSHTYDHCFLPGLSAERAAFQIGQGKRVLEQILGQRVDGFCYPLGAYRQREIALVRDAGFAFARTTRNLWLEAGPDRYRMGTTCQFYPHGAAVFARNYVRGGHWRARCHALRHALLERDWEWRLYALLDAAQRRGGVFHCWLHTRDIERLGLWPALAAWCAHVAAVTPVHTRVTNGELAERRFPATSHQDFLDVNC
ncbi:polysaccharide deacetylase family protein [Duganella margarita]|nr:polysaccharide deacetylase family protein [Duganella margarita]